MIDDLLYVPWNVDRPAVTRVLEKVTSLKTKGLWDIPKP